jgi:hypothetical protein
MEHQIQGTVRENTTAKYAFSTATAGRNKFRCNAARNPSDQLLFLLVYTILDLGIIISFYNGCEYMLCIISKRDELLPRLAKNIGHYRYKVFVKHLGWPLPSSDEVELDEFDGPNAVYVSSHNENGLINGVARLLPTTEPYLLEKIFPFLWEKTIAP